MIIANAKASLLLSFDVMAMPYRAYLQGMQFQAGYWWLLSAQKGLSGADGLESNHVSKFDTKGKYLGRMTLLGSGHGSAFAMVGDDIVIAWFEADGNGRRIRRIQWTKDKRATRDEASVINTGTGTQAWIATPITGSTLNDFCIRRFRDDLSPDHDQFSLRFWNAPSTVRRRMLCPQVKPNNSSTATYQGSITWGDSVYVMYAGTSDRPQRIVQYKWPADNAKEYTVKPFSMLDITNVPAGWSNSWHSKEPEGFCIYNNRLCFGQRFGPTTNRAWRMYMLDAPNTPTPPTPPAPPWPPVTPTPPVPDPAC